MLFGGPNGFNVFHPDSLKDNTYPPPVALTKYLRYNTDDEEGKPIFEKGIAERDSISLTYKDNIVTLEFAALSFSTIMKTNTGTSLKDSTRTGFSLGIIIL